MQHDVVRGDDVPAPVGDTLDCRLERRVRERLDLPAVVADEVVVMLAFVVVRLLEAGDTVTEVDALDEPERGHPVERAVDARDPDARAASACVVVQLLRGQAAVLLAKDFDDHLPGASATAAHVAQTRESGLGPGDHADNDTRSQRRATVSCVRALLLIVVALAATGCAGGDAASDDAVVAAFYPLAWATQRIAVDAIHVENLTPPGAEPHDVELSPTDVEAVRDARLVVYVGGGFQPALEDAVEGRDGRSLDLLGADERDPHIWLDPVRFARAVGDIANELDGSDANALLADLERLDAEYRRGLEDCERDVVVTTHAAFGQLARRYGLTELSLAGRSPESEPGPRELEELIEDVRASGATTVFAEPLVSDEIAETVAHEVGIAVATLDPVEGLSQERINAGEDYLSVMRSNLAALRAALGCR